MIETELIKKYTGNLHVLMRELNCIDFIRHIIVDMTLGYTGPPGIIVSYN